VAGGKYDDDVDDDDDDDEVRDTAVKDEGLVLGANVS